MRKLKPDEILRRRESNGLFITHPVMGIVENVRSVYNVGSMFRTADAAGLSQLFLSGYTGTPEHHRLQKTALGAEKTVPWRQFESGPEAIAAARAEGYRIVALEITDEPRAISDLDVSDYPLCLVVGNEVTGVSDESVAAADFAVEIDQYGHKHSLNAAVAFGVAVFGIVRHYRELTAGQGAPIAHVEPSATPHED